MPDPAAPAPPPPSPGTQEFRDLPAEQRHAQMRGPENPRARGHSPARDYREEVAARTAAPNDPPADPAAPAAPLDTTKYKFGDLELTTDEIKTLAADKAMRDLRAATLPQTPDGYELKLSEGVKLPGGQDVQFRFDEKDAGIAAVRNLAHAKGWSRADLSDVLSVYASHVAGQEAAMAEISRAEISKVGANAAQRVDAASRWVRSVMGEADSKPILASMVTDAQLRFIETVMTKISGQGTMPFSQQHRVAPDSAAIPGYDKMSFEQRRFAQDQQAARGNMR
ncbi:MAG: hypothetical protein H0V72_29385 [Bradyrhizobium sp.]|nr:hypothetical protein [Bradyrhizobium sp.]